MVNLFEKEFGIPKPACCSLADCCKGASPSEPFHQLMERAAKGDVFAQSFFSVMIPYQTHADAEKVVPGLLERTKKAAAKEPDIFKSDDDLVLYHCRYLKEDNRCGVHEDRPQFCRDFPDTPFMVLPPGCAFEPWAMMCRDKYDSMKAEVAQLKQLQEELAELRRLQEEMGQG